MITLILLGVLTVAGLCYGSYRLGKQNRLGQPGRFQRFPKFVDNLTRTEQIRRPPPPRLTKPIPHQPIQSPPVVVTHRIGQGVTAGYYKSLTDPEAEIITAVYYDGTHRDKDIPANTYIVDLDQPRYYSREEFLRTYAPAEVGVVMTPGDIWPDARKMTATHDTPAEPITSQSELEEKMFREMAAELDFPTTPKTYSGPCEHSIAREQLKLEKGQYQGMGHFIPCRECGQKFEFNAEPEQPALAL